MSLTVPMLDLRDGRGASFDWTPLWQRRNLLLFFPHQGCEVCRQVMDRWGEEGPELEAESTVPIAVVHDAGGDLPGFMKVIVDPGGRLAERLGAQAGTVVVADRFFEVMQREPVHELGADKAAADSVAWVRLAEMRCPECGIGTW